MRISAKFMSVAMLLFLCLTAQSSCAAEKKTWTQPPKMTIDPAKKYIATIDTDKGAIVCELYPKEAPITVNSFVFLAKETYFDGLTFHRVEDWVIQGGDPTGTGGGGPGYQIKNEAATNTHKHQPGTLAMARTRDPDSAGSQFYIITGAKDASNLDGGYTIFGQVIKGMDVVKKMASGDTIKSIKIEEQSEEAPAPKGDTKPGATPAK